MERMFEHQFELDKKIQEDKLSQQKKTYQKEKDHYESLLNTLQSKKRVLNQELAHTIQINEEKTESQKKQSEQKLTEMQLHYDMELKKIESQYENTKRTLEMKNQQMLESVEFLSK